MWRVIGVEQSPPPSPVEWGWAMRNLGSNPGCQGDLLQLLSEGETTGKGFGGAVADSAAKDSA